MNLKTTCTLAIGVTLVSLALIGGCQPCTQDLDNRIQYAIISSNLELTQKTLDQSPDPAQLATRYLHIAMVHCHKNHDEILKLLVQNGADINYQNEQNDTVVHSGLQFGGKMTPEMLKWFIENGYTVNLKGNMDQTALSLCIDNAHKLDPEPRNEMINILLDEGADTNTTCPGRIPLLEPLVIWDGANPHAKDQLRRMVNAGADLEVQNSSGQTVLLTAIEYGKEDMAKLLLELGADFNAADKFGTTALFKFANMGMASCVERMIAADANINTVNTGGYTPLHFAAAGGNPEIITMLLDAGAKVNPVNEKGQTPLDIALRQDNCQPNETKQQQMIDLLKKHGAQTAAQLKETNA